MSTYKAATTFVLTAGAAAALAAAAAPASAGGIGDILSPAFGTNCANLKTASHAAWGTASPSPPTSRSAAGPRRSPTPCAAIVDRLTFNGTIIETGTDSYRLAGTRARAEEAAKAG